MNNSNCAINISGAEFFKSLLLQWKAICILEWLLLFTSMWKLFETFWLVSLKEYELNIYSFHLKHWTFEIWKLLEKKSLLWFYYWV